MADPSDVSVLAQVVTNMHTLPAWNVAQKRFTFGGGSDVGEVALASAKRTRVHF
jgi:hypothetical protein